MPTALLRTLLLDEAGLPALRVLLDDIDVGILVIDEGLTFRLVNRLARAIHPAYAGAEGRPMAEVLGRYNPPELTARLLAEFRRLLADGVPLVRQGWQSSSVQPGQDRRFDWTAKRIGSDGAPLILITVADVSEHHRRVADARRAEEELAAKARELARSNADLEQFAYAASHDLREPLRMISGFLGLIRRRAAGALDEEARSWLGQAVSGAARLSGMIDGILEWSRVRGDEPLAPVALGEVVRRSLDDVAVLITERKATISIGDLPIVRGDAKQLARLFQNLVSNALKFHRGERPAVRIGPVPAAADARESIVAVDDDGIGIAPADRERAFVLFQRLGPATDMPGTGIGLATCRRIMDLHGGRIWIEDSPLGGAGLRLAFPR